MIRYNYTITVTVADADAVSWRRGPQLSFEEEALNRHRKLLRTAVAPERDYTLEGLLYYRLRNDINMKVKVHVPSPHSQALAHLICPN